MGIQGLLPFLRKSSRPANLSEFSGQVAAVDSYCWIHRGAISCADKLVLGEATDRYVSYVMKQVNMLLSFKITPILVFDGCNLPAKALTEGKRRENRSKNRAKAKELLREGKVKEARECFQKCVDVTSEMAHNVIKACRSKNVDIIVAPYEADAQLAYLNQCGIADFIITEDSDLVLFGCYKILFKMDSNGGGIFIEKEKLHLSMNVGRDKFSFEKFCNMCILSGCDYLPSLKGIGLARACRFFNATSNPDVYNALCKLPSHLNMPNLEVTQQYRENFIRALNTVLYQLVFDPVSHTLRPLTPYRDGCQSSDLPYCGLFLGHGRAFQIALGNINVQTGEKIDNFDPDKHQFLKPPSSCWLNKNDRFHASIWDKSISFNKEKKLNSHNIDASSMIQAKTLGKECVVKVKLKIKKRKEADEDTITELDLQSMYLKRSPKRLKSGSESDTEDLNLDSRDIAIETKKEENSKSEEFHVEDLKSDLEVPLNDSPPSQLERNKPLLEMSSSTDINESLNISSNAESKGRINPFAKSASKVQDGIVKSQFRLRNAPGAQSIKSHVIVRSRYFSPQLSKPAVEKPELPQNSPFRPKTDSLKSTCNSFKWNGSPLARVKAPLPMDSIFDTPPQSQNKENLLLRELADPPLEQPLSPVLQRKLSTFKPSVKKPNKCRVSGLKKLSTTPKQKQLSLKEMFQKIK